MGYVNDFFCFFVKTFGNILGKKNVYILLRKL